MQVRNGNRAWPRIGAGGLFGLLVLVWAVLLPAVSFAQEPAVPPQAETATMSVDDVTFQQDGLPSSENLLEPRTTQVSAATEKTFGKVRHLHLAGQAGDTPEVVLRRSFHRPVWREAAPFLHLQPLHVWLCTYRC